jgi:hypothetical protein
LSPNLDDNTLTRFWGQCTDSYSDKGSILVLKSWLKLPMACLPCFTARYIFGNSFKGFRDNDSLVWADPKTDATSAIIYLLNNFTSFHSATTMFSLHQMIVLDESFLTVSQLMLGPKIDPKPANLPLWLCYC